MLQLLGLTPTENGNEDRIRLDLTALPADVDRAVIAASRHQRAHFGELENIRLTLTDGSGDGVLGFSIADATVESAFVFGEIYRRNDEWKFRAVGQGYETGLAGLATDYGIEIDEDDEADDESGGITDAPEHDVPGAEENGAADPSGGEESGPVELAVVAEPTAAPLPVPTPREPESTAPAPPRRVRTAKKKVILPERQKSPWPRTTAGGPPVSSPPLRSRATGSVKCERHPSCCQ